MRSVLLAFFIAAFSTAVYALPTGAPRCGINATAIANGHNFQPQDFGFRLNVSPQNAGDMSITITISNVQNSSMNFQGILLYVAGANLTHHLGHFTQFDQTNFHAQTEICKNLGFVGDDASTLTHSNPQPKILGSTQFVWTPLPTDSSEPGPYMVYAAVAGTGNTPAQTPIPWQVVDPVAVNFVASANMLSNSNNNNMSGGNKRYRCKPKSSSY
ncbi:uncharacterized protein BJ171DRAFT_603363 [Polychytrium aggregatum]|uniref:uncharacterized protein n=1 Tax=Polychytrium aggregatum TaxID=110093 RepID=UPI0022FE625F|nr:uncharacterized protein BJ171DRAFT_603363 [Polychytrium aggregatum]KAI9193462.1 hypothetical protein BJ171DRAFT_603363 [Polychytrium aggregatum]